MSLLSALQDDKLALILPVLVRMEHKIDQIMAMMGAKSSAGMNGLQTEKQLNSNMIGNQPKANTGKTQSNSAAMGNESIDSESENQAIPAAIGNQLNSGKMANHLTASLLGKQSHSVMKGNQMATAPIKSNPVVTETQSSASTMDAQSNASLTETHSSDSSVENGGDADIVMEAPTAETSNITPSSNTSDLYPGLPTAQGRVTQRKMAKITENTLPENLSFPISRDNIIAMQAKSTSTMNFAVRLMRELFTLEELDGKNISGARGKDRVDPNRVEIIKEIVFQVYRTLPSDRDMVWRCCRKAMDSFMRRMKRERALKNKTALAETI